MTELTIVQLLERMRELAYIEHVIDCKALIADLEKEARRRDMAKISIQGLAYNALRVDGAHHKQWFLEQILQLVSEPWEYERVRIDSEWKPGVAP